MSTPNLGMECGKVRYQLVCNLMINDDCAKNVQLLFIKYNIINHRLSASLSVAVKERPAVPAAVSRTPVSFLIIISLRALVFRGGITSKSKTT